MHSAAERAVLDAGEHLRLVRKRGKAEAGLKSDELRAAAFLAEAEQKEITTKNDLALVHRFCRPEPAAVGFHQLVPNDDHLEKARSSSSAGKASRGVAAAG